MSEACRRVILKPVGLGEGQLSQFVSSLTAAVELQSQLASQSAHVLQFVGGLQETEHAFVVEHEPASPLSPQRLFDPASPPVEATALLCMAAGISDALKVAHATAGPRPIVHGGLCPGVLLTTPDGVPKVTDFGFAPAICLAVGPESYLNLAVCPRVRGPAELLATGAWEVLASAIVDRPDRLCSFIDPEKYASRMHQSFEPKSDIIAAGFILHLLAEHHHPYFHDDPEAHRMVEVAEYMAMGTATRARRRDLRESSDPAVRRWCDLVARMIDRQPRNRPTAAELAEAFGHQPPVANLVDVLGGPPESPPEPTEEEKQQLAEQQAQIDQARARAEELLRGAGQDLAEDTWDSLHRGEARVAAALDIPEISPSQRDRGQKLRDAIAGKISSMVAEAEVGVAELGKAEDDLRESRRLLDAGRFAKAEEKARPHVRSSFPNIKEEADRIVAEIGEALGRHRAELRRRLDEADDQLRQGRFEQAPALAAGVEKDENADDILRTKARQIIDDAQAASKRTEDARRKAISDRDQALAALREGGLDAARAQARSVVDNPHADAEVRADAERILSRLPELEAGKTLMDAEDFPGAVQAFDHVLQGGDGAAWPPARAAAERLKNRAVRLRRDKLAGSIHEHLTHRAEREETSNVDISPPDEILPVSAPDWVRTTLTDFETFLQDCAVTGKPAFAGKQLVPGDRLGEKYEILEFLGRGGMGEVYRARDLSLDREVALKLAAPAAESGHLAEALRNEAKAIAALTHPHIIHINSFDVIDDRPCFDTNYIRGHDLDQYASRRALSWREMARILIPIAEALAYAHKRGVLHRDVKPQNIYLSADERGQVRLPRSGPSGALGTIEPDPFGPWLIDFGLARMRSLCDRRANTGLCGTPGFIAPEVITSMGEDVDHRADIFALGCVLYGLLTKEPPFGRGETPTSSSRPSISRTLLNTLRSQTVPLTKAASNAPEALRRICERAMAHELEDRYQDAGEMARDLRRFLLELDRQEAETTLAQARERLERRPRNELVELEALDEVRTLADNARSGAEDARRRAEDGPDLADEASRHAIDEVKRHAVKLAEDAQRIKQQIVASQAEARHQLHAAGEDAAAGQFRAALAAARAVAANPYVPDLHDEAREIARQAERQVRTAVRKVTKLAAGIGSALIVVFAVGWYGFLASSPPKITLGPKDAAVNVGETVTFAVEATGKPQPTYQWQRKTGESWSVLAGKTQPALSLGPVQRDDSGDYQCVVSNGKGPDQKLTVTLSVNLPPPPPTAALSWRKQGEGTVELAPPGERFAKGTQVTLTAKPADDWRFDHWEGDLTGKEAQSVLVMDKDRSVTAVFVQVPVLFALSTRAKGQGSVNVAPEGERFAKKTQVTLTAKPADDWRFDRWEGDLTGREARSVLVMDKDRSVTAVFVQVPVLFALSTRAKGQGSVNVAPEGERFAKKTQVTLTAKPADDWRFDRWEGDLTGREARSVLVMDKDRSVTAVFVQVPVLFALSTRAKGQGSVNVAPEGERFAKGTQVTLMAKPADDWRFDHWEGDLTGKEARLVLTIDNDRNVTAVFVQIPAMHTLATPAKGQGVVDAVPPGGRYAKGTEVTLTANPATGWRFDRWEGDPAIQGNPVKVKVDKDTTLTAVFIQSGWPSFDEAAAGKIKTLLVGKQNHASPLKGFDPDWVRLRSDGGKLYIDLSCPGYGRPFVCPAMPIPFPNAAWPANVDQQLTKTAETIATALQKAADSDLRLTAVLLYFAFWEKRVALEKELVAELPAGANGPANLDVAKLSGKSGYLSRLARIKWMSGDVPDTPDIGAWTQHLQEVLSKNRNVQQIAIQVRPTRFIEYFWGPEFVHAIYWFVDQPGSATVKYARLGTSADIGAQVRDLVTKKLAPPKLGDKLLGPILRDMGADGKSLKFLAISDPRKSFGLALAPDGPLCFVPILRLPFEPAAVDLSVPDVAVISDVPRRLTGSITQLDALYKDAFKTAHTAAWVLVSLGAAPAPDKALMPTELWEVPAEMLAATRAPAETLMQQRLAAAQSIHDFGRAFNADVICFKTDQVAVTNLLRTGIRAVDNRFNDGAGGESFDAGFVYPRLGDVQTPWFVLVANAVEAGK